MENEAFFGSPTGQGWQLQSIGLPWGESSLCSIVSSPSTDTPPSAVAGDSVVIPELISRLGGTCTCTCDEISSSSSLDSPKNLDISVLTNPPSAAAHTPFSTDPGFAGTPKRCFIFAGRGGELSRVPSNQSLKSSGSAKRRKAAPRRKTKEAPLCSSVTTATNPHKVSLKTPWEEDGNANRSKIKEGSGDEKDVDEPKAPSRKPVEEEEEEKTTKRPESPRDYIHVRARRGQATDSHSLAERVRREKISERMKLLQDLVPGCNKVTGKAVMLDEIINYVQALQGQVEFLSMKLAMIYPQVEFNMDIHGVCEAVSPLEVTSTGQSSLDLQLPPIELGAFWEDDLQTVVQMGFGNMMADACKASYTIDWLS